MRVMKCTINTYTLILVVTIKSVKQKSHEALLSKNIAHKNF